MGRNWEYAIQATVQANRYIPVPPEIREVVELDHALDGPSVYWNYETDSQYVLLSREAVTRPDYVDVGRYKVYDADGDGSQVRVRPPDGLADAVRGQFAEGNRVVFLAYSEMADNGMVYLLSTDQLLTLLPDAETPDPAATADGGLNLRQTLLKLPSFLPPL